MNAHDVLMYGHLWVLKHLDGLSEPQLEHPNVCGIWSTKDIVAHLASYELVLVEVFNSFTNPGPTPTLDRLKEMNGDSFNALQVGQRKSKTPGEALAEYKSTYEQCIQILPRLDPSLLRQAGRLPWYGEEYSLEDFIVYQYYGHKREHMAQVAVYRDTLKG